MYEDKLIEMAREIAELNAKNTELAAAVENHERRIQILEGPRVRMMQLIRSLKEYELGMLADDLQKEEYERFRWILPKEALYQATDEAIENGLLSSIEIGTKKNIRSLTSIRLTFNNGRREF